MPEGFKQEAIYRIIIHIILLLLVFPVSWTKGQQVSPDLIDQAYHMLEERGEVVIDFQLPPGYNAAYFSSFLSVDGIIHDTLTAYANSRQFDIFLLLDIPFRVLTPPSLKGRVSETAPGPEPKVAIEVLAGYPSYDQYLALMQEFEAQHPDLCRVVEYGQSEEGRKLLVMKISDHPDTNEEEPAFLYSSTLHGDEVLGYVLMLRLIGELLENYGTDDQVTHLVDQMEIWINPLSNPDGAYYLTDESVAGATRGNANSVDLNRNFPDPSAGDHPDGNEWQPETLALMELMEGIDLVMAANFHGGVEVVNYPWDTWSRLHADDNWYQGISRTYADTVHAVSPPGYMTFGEDGITNGYAWYSISGGKQDYSNYYLGAREVTIELSDEKMPDETDLSSYWLYNRKSLLGYMEQALFGVRGKVRDASTGQPVRAEIFIDGHDKDHSQVWSSEETGEYYRLLPEGYVQITFQNSGYKSATHTVLVPDRGSVEFDVTLEPLTEPFTVYPNPFIDRMHVYIPESYGDMQVDLFDSSGRRIRSFEQQVSEAGWQQIVIDGIPEGVYVLRITCRDSLIREKVIRAGQ